MSEIMKSVVVMLAMTPVFIIILRLIFKDSVSFYIYLSMFVVALVVALSSQMNASDLSTTVIYLISSPLGLIIMTTIIIIMNRIIIKPIKKITVINEELALGRTNIELDSSILKASGEVGKMARSTQKLLTSLKASISVANKVSDGFVGFEEGEIRGEGDLDNALRKMTSSLREIISTINMAAENVASGSEQISKSAQSLSSGASEQASATEEASSSLEEMSASISQNAENADHTSSITKQIKDKIDIIVKAAEETNLAMNSIVEKIGVINEIATKTDLLAINAAIEAARAGEHGKGFAVVATEVRELAESSLKSATEIENLSNESLKKAEHSNTLLQELSPEISNSSNLVEEIAAASMEQRSGIGQVNTALQQLSDVTQQNAALSEEMSTSSEELSGQAEKLYESISFFKTSRSEYEKYNIREVEQQIQKFQHILKSMESGQKETRDKKSPGKVKAEDKKEGNEETKARIKKKADDEQDDNFEKF